VPDSFAYDPFSIGKVDRMLPPGARVHERFLGGLGLWGIYDRESSMGNGLCNFSVTRVQIPVGQAQVLGRLRGTIDPSTSTGGKQWLV